MSFFRHPLLPHALLLCLCITCLHEVTLAPTGKLEAYFLDIGQGDSTLLISPTGHTVLIDGGPDKTVLSRLALHLPFFDRTIDLMVMTHPDSDHSAGLLSVLQHYHVRAALITGVQSDTKTYRAVLEELARQHIAIITPDPATDIVFDDGVRLDEVWPQPGLWGKKLPDTNNPAIVLRTLWQDRSILLTADIEAPAENAILRSGADLAAQVLKVAHHGSKTSSGTGFVLAVAPTRAMISAAKKNAFGHPNPEIVARYAALHIPIHVTGWEGEGKY